MPEQPHWHERTLDMPPQDPWADQPTAPGPSMPGPSLPGPSSPAVDAGPRFAAPGGAAEPPSPFSQGRARVDPQAHHRQFASTSRPAWAGPAPMPRTPAG
jgi:hypothetical protein